jgi:S1-C subfamily serine protease
VTAAAFRTLLAIGVLHAAGCVSPEAPVVPQHARHSDSPLPGTIGIVVKGGTAGVVVAAVKQNSPAADAGLRVGDVVVRYNGVSITDSDQLYRMMLDSAPGSTARVELLRAGTVHRLDVPVEQIDTAWRA